MMTKCDMFSWMRSWDRKKGHEVKSQVIQIKYELLRNDDISVLVH